ncbi:MULTISPECIES: hypothetical protein [Heyndrickxia]|uniref:Uncharacterized protein n=2 Tax=Heyndrickxia coagulans TaxID=1398 RepID=A0A150K1D3_HEYCO|nr:MULTISPECIES: hypothetical protein [Heyndrickxia]AEH52927.1 hypothetical protein BCO26_0868 [Heyndrickxia coagulans 2-6]AJH77700.1 hypothetical protein BF29_3399 [Heyndrickxia coagulans DSM 1 = ATCC 7050]KYC61119.1 hypothetical protein B4098_0267 [Heyndrickxia coagulans]KYC63161.1 hypothetical protein B4100_0321 [Heyndrickxia coagulans]KYC67660.1 hypothetical protein B4099_0385 [Heyndrickxia coagulans]
METWFYLHVINTLYFVFFMFVVPPAIAAMFCRPEIKKYLEKRKEGKP